MQALLLGLGLLGVVIIGAYWFANSEPRSIIRVGRVVAGVVLVGVAIVLLVGGRLPFALAALAFALPMLMRLRALRNYARSAFGPAQGQRSALRTRYLEVTLDHDSGEMDGVVTQGPGAGRELSGMDLEELRDLAESVADDPQSHQILTAYIQRRFGEEAAGAGRAAGSGPGAGTGTGTGTGGSAAMTEDEAWQILGLEPGADDGAIKSAHRRLMRQFHPDQGGSAYFAAKLNQARDLLLGRRRG